MLKLFALFTIVPLVELALLIKLGSIIGVLDTILLIVFTGAAGAILARTAGIQCLFTVRRQLQSGIFPADELCSGLLILIAGAFLIAPGLLTDCAGLALLVPAVRGAVTTQLRAYLEKKITGARIVYTDHR
ncbi:MAG: FxsA family protein [Deltaproteobacteria bacterium]|nr:FxsA family protein [Deltaproteobacteria bacterium]